jgi:hypothetical protein
MSVIDERLEEILQELNEEEGNNLPPIAAPGQHRIRGAGGQGSWLASLLDPDRHAESVHVRQLRQVERDTQLQLHKIKGETLIEKAKLWKEAQVNAYRRQAAEWETVEDLDHEGEALIAKYDKFHRLARKIIERGYDPELQKQLVKELYGRFFGRNGNHEGR